MERSHAQPQGDGDPRRFQIHGDADKPRLVHVEKSGPAFLPVPVADQLGRSLVVQTLRIAAEVLNALDRRCFLDVMPAWGRLLKAADLQLPLSRTYPRQSWEFAEMRDAVMFALLHVEEPHALMRWIVADSLLRGYAMTLAHGSESHLSAPGDHLTVADVERIQAHAKAYRAFSEGRS